MRGPRLFGILAFLFLSLTAAAFAQEAEEKLPEWLVKEYDAKLAITWYKVQPKNIEFTNTFSLAVGQRLGGKPWLVLRIAYTYSWERDILLIYKFTIKADGATYVVRTGFNSVNRSMDAEKKVFSEWYENYVYDDLAAAVNAASRAKRALIGFQGVNGNAEREIGPAEKESLIAMLDLMKKLGEK